MLTNRGPTVEQVTADRVGEVRLVPPRRSREPGGPLDPEQAEAVAHRQGSGPLVVVATDPSTTNITTAWTSPASTGLTPARISPVIAPGRKTSPPALVVSICGTSAVRAARAR